MSVPDLRILSVVTEKDRDAFIRLPERLHRGAKGWVVPLRSQERIDLFDEAKNPSLRAKKRKAVLATRADLVVGRAIFYLDEPLEASMGTRCAFFGHLEAEDEGVARSLFAWAEERAREAGRTRLVGPVDLVSQKWGVLLERNEESAPLMGMWNPPATRSWYENAGWTTLKDLVAFRVDRARGDRFAVRPGRASELLRRRFGLGVRTIDMARFGEEVDVLVDLANRGFGANWGYVPASPEEGRALARDLKPLMRKEFVLFAHDGSGKAVGFLLVLPDVNRILANMNGSLFPFGFVKLFAGLSRLRRYRIFGLAVEPAWQGRGVGNLLVEEAVRLLDHPEAVAEIDWVLSDNPRMLAILARMGITSPHKRYRVYEKDVSGSSTT